MLRADYSYSADIENGRLTALIIKGGGRGPRLVDYQSFPDDPAGSVSGETIVAGNPLQHGSVFVLAHVGGGMSVRLNEWSWREDDPTVVHYAGTLDCGSK